MLDQRHRVDELLAGLRLRVRPGKTAGVPTRAGITFVGYRAWPHRREVRGTNVRAFLKRLRQVRKLVDAGKLALADVRIRVMGWCGHTAQAESFRLHAGLAKR